MKGFLASLLLMAAPMLYSQDYLDLMTVAYGRTPTTGYDAGGGQTTLSTLDLNVLLPVPLTERVALMTGVNGLVNRLQLEPQNPETGLYTFALQLGINYDYGNGWTSTHMIFPRISSAFDQDPYIPEKKGPFAQLGGWLLSQYGRTWPNASAPVHLFLPLTQREMGIQCPASVQGRSECSIIPQNQRRPFL
jgi:hypothetical protein